MDQSVGVNIGVAVKMYGITLKLYFGISQTNKDKKKIKKSGYVEKSWLYKGGRGVAYS